MAEEMKASLDRLMALPIIDDKRVPHVPFREIAADPIAAVRKICEHREHAMTDEFEQRVRAWLADPENQVDRYGRFSYSYEAFGLDKAWIETLFSDYSKRFGLKISRRRPMVRDEYFLSVGNPVATVDQIAVEDTALRLIARPEMQKSRAMAANLFRWVMTQDVVEQIGALKSFLDEYMFHYALRAANSDANYPKIARFMVPPHHWFGRDVPGSRWAGDSPDFIYRTVSVSYGPRYEIRGRATCASPPTAYFALMEDRPAAPTILALIETMDMQFEANGEFVITVDPTPANGRRKSYSDPARHLADLDPRRARRLGRPKPQRAARPSLRPAGSRSHV